MKRTTAILLFSSLIGIAVLALMSRGNVFDRASAGSHSVTIESAEVGALGNVTVDLIVTAPPAGIGAYIIDVTYNSLLLDATSCQSTAPANVDVCNADYDSNTARFAGGDAQGLVGMQTLGELTFHAGALGGKSVLDLDVVEMLDANGADIADEAAVIDGSILVQGETPTPTQTLTPTRTFTPTLTPTATFTATATLTPTPTETLTPSLTPTGTLSPTATATATITATRTPTATRTITPTNTLVLTPVSQPGDVDCDGDRQSTDATLVLQYSARFLTSLPCLGAGDLNGDGIVDSRDATIILQFVAGLLTTL
jgi:hypothetical protein